MTWTPTGEAYAIHRNLISSSTGIKNPAKSKDTVVLRRWGRSKQKFCFIKRVDKCWITTVKDLESWRFES